MPASYDELIEFLSNLGTEKIAHTQGSFLEHLIAVYRDLVSWGADEEICRAGMFHSIYGTEKFQKFSLPVARRDEVRRLIGERAERLAYLNCVMDRTAFDREIERGTPPFCVRDRLTQQEVQLSPADFEDLCRVHLCDWLEQVPRCKQWSYRRQTYQRLAARLGGVAHTGTRNGTAGGGGRAA